MMCAAWNTVITMLLLGVWEVEVGGGDGGGGGGECERWRWGVRRRGRGGKEEMVHEHVCKIYFVTNNKGTNKVS